MKVALSFPSINRRGGVERIALECANFLARRGHDVQLLCTTCERNELAPEVTVVPVPARLSPPPVRLLSFALQSRRALANLQGIEAVGAFGAMSPRGVYWAQSVHAAWMEIAAQRRDLSGRFKQKLNPTHPVALAFEKAAYGGQRYDKMVALTSEVAADLKRFYRVPANDIAIIPNGFSPAEFNAQRAVKRRTAMREKLGLASSDRAIIFVANETQRKGFGPLLRSIGALNDPKLHLLAVGKLDLEPFQSEIEQLGLKNRLHAIGPTSNVADYFAAADVFALPTQYEAWGLVIIEALATGLPVVTSALAGAAVAVKPGQTGVLLDDPDKESEIAAGLCACLQGFGRSKDEIAQSVSSYAWDEVLLRYEEVLRESVTIRAARVKI